MIRNRIKDHRKVRAGDLLPHPWNFRQHPEAQRAAFEALYEQVGFARSLLAYELPDGSLQLIDGHLRRDIDPEMEVDVEVLDIAEEEARVLLLSIDPLADLAETSQQLHQRLMEITPTESDELRAAWQATVDGLTDPDADPGPEADLDEQYLVLITCRDEEHQVELLQKLQAEGLPCRALLS